VCLAREGSEALSLGDGWQEWTKRSPGGSFDHREISLADYIVSLRIDPTPKEVPLRKGSVI